MDIVSILNGIFALCGMAGGFVAYLSSRKSGITGIQQQTITALQQRIETVEKAQKEVKEENTRLKTIIETIQTALLKRGIHVTIDGEMVMISDPSGTISSLKSRRSKTKAHPPAPTPEE